MVLFELSLSKPKRANTEDRLPNLPPWNLIILKISLQAQFCKL
jgi:hypothetical protein